MTGSTRKEDNFYEHKKIILTKNVRSLSLVNMDKFMFPKDFIVFDTQLIANMINQIPIVLGRPFLTTSNAVIYYRSGQLELSFENFKVTLSIFNGGNNLIEYDDSGSIQIFDSLVSNPFSHILYNDPLEVLLEYCGIDFYHDASIRKVNALLDFIPLMDVTNKIANIKLLPDDEWTHDVPKKPPIFDIKRWPP